MNLQTPPPQNHYIKALITASHCCICRKHLTDTESLQLGLGPDCSKRYYDPMFVPSEDDILNAMGLLHKGSTEGKFPSDLIEDLRGLRGNARLFSNRLVYFISCHYDKRDTVLACAGIIRALGYTVMADKLEVDRVKARITDDTGSSVLQDTATSNIRLYVTSAERCQKDLARIPGAKNDLPKEGYKVGWTIPKAQQDYAMCVLGIHFHGDLVSVAGKGISVLPRRSWHDLQRFRNPAPVTLVNPMVNSAVAPVTTGQILRSGTLVEVVIQPTHLEVRTPYNKGFVEALRSNIPYRDRKWNGVVWIIGSHHLDQIKAMIQTHYQVTI